MKDPHNELRVFQRYLNTPYDKQGKPYKKEIMES